MNEMRQSLDQDTERKLREHDEAYRKLPSQRNADMFAARFIGKHVGKGPQLAAKVAVFAMQTTPPQAETNIGRLARVRAMTDKAKNPEEVRAMLSAIESLPVEQRRDAEMALRVLLETRAIGCLTPGLTNVVVQFVNINQVKQNDAVNATKDIEDYLNKPGGSYRGECESIIGGMLNNTDEDSIEKAILSAVRKMNAGNDSKAIFEVPSWMADSFSKVLKGQNLFKNEQRNRETGAIESIESNDPRIKVQIIEQEGEPDVRTQFKFGIAVLEWVRRGGESGKTDEADKALLNLIAFMIDGYLDPHTGLKDLLFKNVMKIRKIDWRIMDQQRKSWEAVATAL
jgi:hypothetical protein